MQRVSTIIIGGGQAGLAMSACLSSRGVSHAILERKRIAERWRSERWDSLRLLTPNWMNRLPGWSYDGSDPDGFMAAPDVAAMLEDYASHIAAPIHTGTNVMALENTSAGYRVSTNSGEWLAGAVVIATGHCDSPHVPGIARCLSPAIRQVHASEYRNPGALPEGRILVVGASASGLQIAHELASSGRDVTLAVGRHIRMPRRYCGRDIMWWLEVSGILGELHADVPDIRRARQQPSLQLSGQHDMMDLATASRIGVRLAGRLIAIDGPRARFGADLPQMIAASDAKLQSLLSRIDRLTGNSERDRTVSGPLALYQGQHPGEVDLVAQGFSCIVWATGYRRNYSWLRIPILDAWGEIIHDGGVTPSPGLYVMGLNFMRRRKSTFIGGVGEDAEELSAHITSHLACIAPARGVKSHGRLRQFNGGHNGGFHAASA
jgi:putative flavoprotein involved in K+ transport